MRMNLFTRCRVPLVGLIIATVPVAWADTITLNDGTTYTGKVISDTAETVILQVQVSSSIRDEKTIPKADIKSFEKDGPDIGAYAALTNRKPDPYNSLPLAEYQRSIEEQKVFLEQHPSSQFAAEVRANVEALEAEKAKVEAGSVKLSGYWMNQEEASTRKALVSGLRQLSLMRTLAARGDLPGALNAFDAIEKTSALTAAYPEAVDLALKVLAALEQQVDQSLFALQKIKADMKRTMEMAGLQRRAQLQAAVQRENLGFESSMANAERLNLKWPPLLMRHEPSLTKLKQLLPSEKARLAAVPVAKMRFAQQSAAEAQKQLDARNLDAAEQALVASDRSWPQFESASFLKDKLQEAIAKQEEEAKAAEAAAAAAAKVAATPTPTPVPATPEPTAVVQAVTPEEPSFFMSLSGIAPIAGGLIALAAAIAIISRLKKSKLEEEA